MERYKIIYYNITDKKASYNTIYFDDYELALTQYEILSERYQYTGLIDTKSGKLLRGNLFD